MKNQVERVLNILKQKGHEGVTVHDFGKGFRLGARIYDLRQLGYDIMTCRVESKMARYVLKGGK